MRLSGWPGERFFSLKLDYFLCRILSRFILLRPPSLPRLTPPGRYPESVPINHLVPVEGTPLHGLEPLDSFEFVRTIAVARITMPKARVRLSAGRRQMGEAVQALCFLAGANSIFYGDKLLTTGNPEAEDDRALLNKLGLRTRVTASA
jgi:biotin synthase